MRVVSKLQPVREVHGGQTERRHVRGPTLVKAASLGRCSTFSCRCADVVCGSTRRPQDAPTRAHVRDDRAGDVPLRHAEARFRPLGQLQRRDQREVAAAAEREDRDVRREGEGGDRAMPRQRRRLRRSMYSDDGGDEGFFCCLASLSVTASHHFLRCNHRRRLLARFLVDCYPPCLIMRMISSLLVCYKVASSPCCCCHRRCSCGGVCCAPTGVGPPGHCCRRHLQLADPLLVGRRPLAELVPLEPQRDLALPVLRAVAPVHDVAPNLHSEVPTDRPGGSLQCVVDVRGGG